MRNGRKCFVASLVVAIILALAAEVKTEGLQRLRLRFEAEIKNKADNAILVSGSWDGLNPELALKGGRPGFKYGGLWYRVLAIGRCPADRILTKDDCRHLAGCKDDDKDEDCVQFIKDGGGEGISGCSATIKDGVRFFSNDYRFGDYNSMGYCDKTTPCICRFWADLPNDNHWVRNHPHPGSTTLTQLSCPFGSTLSDDECSAYAQMYDFPWSASPTDSSTPGNRVPFRAKDHHPSGCSILNTGDFRTNDNPSSKPCSEDAVCICKSDVCKLTKIKGKALCETHSEYQWEYGACLVEIKSDSKSNFAEALTSLNSTAWATSSAGKCTALGGSWTSIHDIVNIELMGQGGCPEAGPEYACEWSDKQFGGPVTECQYSSIIQGKEGCPAIGYGMSNTTIEDRSKEEEPGGCIYVNGKSYWNTNGKATCGNAGAQCLCKTFFSCFKDLSMTGVASGRGRSTSWKTCHTECIYDDVRTKCTKFWRKKYLAMDHWDQSWADQLPGYYLAMWAKKYYWEAEKADPSAFPAQLTVLGHYLTEYIQSGAANNKIISKWINKSPLGIATRNFSPQFMIDFPNFAYGHTCFRSQIERQIQQDSASTQGLRLPWFLNDGETFTYKCPYGYDSPSGDVACHSNVMVTLLSCPQCEPAASVTAANYGNQCAQYGKDVCGKKIYYKVASEEYEARYMCNWRGSPKNAVKVPSATVIFEPIDKPTFHPAPYKGKSFSKKSTYSTTKY